jgi:hypothetical protein
VLFLAVLAVSAIVTGQVPIPDTSTRAGLDYAGRFPGAVTVGYLAGGLGGIFFLVTFVAVFAVLRVRWPVRAHLVLVGATWEVITGLSKALTSAFIVPGLGAAYLAADPAAQATLLPLGAVVEGLRRGLQRMDTYGVLVVFVLIALLPRETGIPQWVRWLGWVFVGLFVVLPLIPGIGFVGFILASLLFPVWAFLLGRWLQRQASLLAAEAPSTAQ